MSRIFKAGEREYKLEYGVEASLCSGCVDDMVRFSAVLAGAESAGTYLDGLSESEKEKGATNVLMKILSEMAGIPSMAVNVLYAGLLEHHGMNGKGDKTVKSVEDVKDIIRAYFADHAADDTGTFYDVLRICMEQMAADRFTDRIGLEKMLPNDKQEESTQKKKVTKKAKNVE